MRRVGIATPRQPQLPGFDDEVQESISEISVSAGEEAAENTAEDSEAEGYDIQGNSLFEESEEDVDVEEPDDGRKKS